MSAPRLPADDPLDRMLRDFFAREMPEELRSASETSASVGAPARVAPRRAKRGRWLAGLLATGAVACCALFLVARRGAEAPVVTPRPDRGLLGESEMRGDASAARPVATEDELARGPLFVIEGPARHESAAAPIGPHGERVPVTNVRMIEEGTLPFVPRETAVEILPLEGDPVTPALAPRGPADPRLPEEAERQGGE